MKFNYQNPGNTSAAFNWVLAAILSSYVGLANAADYYVSPTGNASWSNCTNISTPCSAQSAMANATAGDTVHFRGGTYAITGTRTPYHGLLEPENHGTSGNPIIFQAYQNEIPTISVNCTSSDNQCVAIGTNSKNYITWDGFTLTSSNNKTAGAFIGGQQDSTGAVFKNNTVYAGSLAVSNSDNFDITRMENTINASYINNKVGGLNSNDRTTNSSNNACLKMYFNDGATITNNVFSDCPSGLSAKANINNSFIRYNFFNGNYVNLEVHVYNNVIRDSSNNTVDHNIFANAGYISLNIQANGNGKASNWDIHNNTFYSNGGGKFVRHLWLGASEGLTFYNNVIVGSGKQFTTVKGFSDIVSMEYNNFGTGPIHIELRRYEESSATYTSLGDWRTSGEEVSGGNPGTGSIAQDPLFMNTSGNFNQIADFALSGGSPSKATGRNGDDMGANTALVGSSLTSPPKPPSVQLVNN